MLQTQSGTGIGNDEVSRVRVTWKDVQAQAAVILVVVEGEVIARFKECHTVPARLS